MRRSDSTRTGGLLRRLLLGILLIGMLGTAAELLLLEHTESATQWIPLAALGVGLASGTLVAVRPRRATLRLLRAVMILFVLTGGLGVYLHYRGNVEFEREMYPSMEGFELFWSSVKGATPALAPAAMAWFGLVGIAFTVRHPRMRADGPVEPASRDEREGKEQDA